MKPFEISLSSWHFRFIKKMVDSSSVYLLQNHPEHQNTCEYMRLFALAIWRVLWVTVLVLLVAVVFVAYPLTAIGQVLKFWSPLDNEALANGLAIATIYAGGIVIYAVANALVLAAPLLNLFKREPKTNGAFSELVDLNRSKICVPVTFKD